MNGPFQGRKLLLRAGQTLKIGRTELADFALPHDANMSRVHFAIECGSANCKAIDLQSINGTLVNNKPIESQELKNGDTIKAGTTIFSVIMNQSSPVANTPAPTHESATPPPISSEPIASPKPLRPTVVDFSSVISTEFPFATAFQDEAPEIRQTALMAAAWQSQPWLLDYCRRSCSGNVLRDWMNYWLLAVLGRPSDAALILSLGRSKELNENRFLLLATFGHPAVLPELIRAMKNHEIPAAIAAAQAWEIVTGMAIGDRENPSSPEATAPPDYASAERFWSASQQKFNSGTRWRRGVEIGGDVPREVLEKLDMKTRWEICLRNAYEGRMNDATLSLTPYDRFQMS